MIDELCRKLGYAFSDKKILKRALTHRSYGNENNERLEFLGDSIVNFVIADALHAKFLRAKEGELSRWRATLVNRETLGELGREFDLGRYLFLGQGELKSGGSERQSILSCAMEAIIGAIYLDGGFEAARESVLRWYEPQLRALTKASSFKDPKTALQEYLQQKKQKLLPIYTVEEMTGDAHEQHFIVSCFIENLNKKTIGEGSSRRRAEQASAEAMLGLIKNERK